MSAIQFDLFGAVIARKIKPHVAHNSGNHEWYTPAEYIEAARAVMGTIDLDPASSITANEIVHATTFYTAHDNGLSQPWVGNVWMNPPYSNGLCERFTNKLCYHVDAGHIPQAIVLVNNATDTKWFTRLVASAAALVFTTGRIKYLGADLKSRNTPIQGQAFLYCGAQVKRFLAEFDRFGWGCILHTRAKPVITLFDM